MNERKHFIAQYKTDINSTDIKKVTQIGRHNTRHKSIIMISKTLSFWNRVKNKKYNLTLYTQNKSTKMKNVTFHSFRDVLLHLNINYNNITLIWSSHIIKEFNKTRFVIFSLILFFPECFRSEARFLRNYTQFIYTE